VEEVKEVEETLDDYSEVAEEQHDELDYDESIYIWISPGYMNYASQAKKCPRITNSLPL